MASENRADTTLYVFLGIDPEKEDVLALSMKELARAYKRAALKWHPDKNLDDPLATEKFSKVFLAYETLSDPEKRKLYDDKIRAERLSEKLFEQLDLKRKTMRKNLESRERKGETWWDEDAGVDNATLEKVKAEIERLRREVPATNSGRISKVDIELRDKDDLVSGGSWACVSGYLAFRKSSDLKFGSFEEDVLAGEHPF